MRTRTRMMERATHLSLATLLMLSSVACKSRPPQPETAVLHSPASPTSQPASTASPRPSDPQVQPDQRYSSRRHASRIPAADSPGAFDFYLLNLSWSPEFCSLHRTAPECASHLGFVLHGLWPQNTNGTYPDHCSNAPGPSNPSAYRDIYPDASLLAHEWTTHGTCSGLAADAYFALARRAITSVKVPATFNQPQQFSLTPEAILSQFTGSNPAIPRPSLALSCGNNLLTAVEVCFDKNLHAVVCGGVRSCRAQTVRILPRGGN